ncbi:MAG: hypothetical protein Ct9H300mP5_4290 [Candidatus Pelagibacterales bacterium]|nr:MAG: hypothetical protein Ct9H300mP5_4290 [Pelagibacterales bacterium]
MEPILKICPKNENFSQYYEKIIEDLKSKGTNVYFIPGGGSNPKGALGYVECLKEIIKENNKYNFFTNCACYREMQEHNRFVSR